MWVEFIRRDPGDNCTLTSLYMTSVPRQGETVTVDGQTAHEVHSVTYDVSNPLDVIVRVLLRV